MVYPELSTSIVGFMPSTVADAIELVSGGTKMEMLPETCYTS